MIKTRSAAVNIASVTFLQSVYLTATRSRLVYFKFLTRFFLIFASDLRPLFYLPRTTNPSSGTKPPKTVKSPSADCCDIPSVSDLYSEPASSKYSRRGEPGTVLVLKTNLSHFC